MHILPGMILHSIPLEHIFAVPCLFPLPLPLSDFYTSHLINVVLFQILLIGSVTVDSQQDVDDSYRIIHVTTSKLFFFSLVI